MARLDQPANLVPRLAHELRPEHGREGLADEIARDGNGLSGGDVHDYLPDRLRLWPGAVVAGQWQRGMCLEISISGNRIKLRGRPPTSLLQQDQHAGRKGQHRQDRSAAREVDAGTRANSPYRRSQTPSKMVPRRGRFFQNAMRYLDLSGKGEIARGRDAHRST